MTEKDLVQVLRWRNHADVRRFMYTQHEITIDEHESWFEQTSKDRTRHLLIFEVNGESAGFVNFNQHGLIHVADWGFYLAPSEPNGTGCQLGLAALDYAFGKLNLHKVCGEALVFNERSIRFHMKLGFKQEGILREQHFEGENYHNVMCFGLLDHEWKKIRENQ